MQFLRTLKLSLNNFNLCASGQKSSLFGVVGQFDFWTQDREFGMNTNNLVLDRTSGILRIWQKKDLPHTFGLDCAVAEMRSGGL
jgi:hypothetical protein